MSKLKSLMVLATASVAVAVGASPAVAQATGVQVGVHPFAQGDSMAAACNGEVVSEFGNVGCKKTGTKTLVCRDWDEAFVIAPGRTIWHAWRNSGGWKEMPHNGRADDTWKCYLNGKGQRQVEVAVGNRFYYSVNSGGWRPWKLYPSVNLSTAK